MSLRVLQVRSGRRAAWLPLGPIAFALLFAGCASTSSNNVQVVDRQERQTVPRITTGHHVVGRGDTISSIARRYGWDWRELAAYNRLSAPYLIRPGQRILFGPASRTVAAPVVRQPVPAKEPSVASSTASTPSVAPVVTKPPVRPVETQAQAKPPETPPAVQTSPARSPSGWAWPADGPLVGRFSSNGSLNKGIDISGQLGQPVLAASDGSVVYAGGGLRGYGELIIIKHSDIYVSAYGHNRRLLVREGQKVKAGQTIAEMGSTGTDRVKLHFEIRRQGKPVDPLQYLPSR